jgi:hypothetical protein
MAGDKPPHSFSIPWQHKQLHHNGLSSFKHPYRDRTATFDTKSEAARKLLKGVEELRTYVERNRQFIPNYGERYRNGERIASGFVESAVNQVVSKRMVKRQQMGWSQRGAHLLLQIRTRVLNQEWENTFRRWYPGFRPRPYVEANNAA